MLVLEGVSQVGGSIAFAVDITNYGACSKLPNVEVLNFPGTVWLELIFSWLDEFVIQLNCFKCRPTTPLLLQLRTQKRSVYWH